MQYTGKITNGKIDTAPLQREAQQHDGKNFVITFEIADGVQYFQHKYYRSCVLPALADCYGESNKQYLHDYVVKPEYFYQKTGEYFIPVEGYDAIPKKHQARSRKIEIYTPEEKIAIIGYIPSTSNMTQKEMRSYILWCENLLCNFMGGAMDGFYNHEFRKGAGL